MVDRTIVNIVQEFMRAIRQRGIPVSFCIVFGSYAAGQAHEWSDIDLLVVSPVFDGDYPREKVFQLWRATAGTDTRIEPVPCGEKQWEEDDVSTIVEMARRDGIRVDLPDTRQAPVS